MLYPFVALQLPEGSSVEEDDEVSFEGRVNVATGARKATSVQLCSKATEQPSKRELGQVEAAAYNPVAFVSSMRQPAVISKYGLSVCGLLLLLSFWDAQGLIPHSAGIPCHKSFCSAGLASWMMVSI